MITRAALLAVLMAVAAVGCGGGDGEGSANAACPGLWRIREAASDDPSGQRAAEIAENVDEWASQALERSKSYETLAGLAEGHRDSVNEGDWTNAEVLYRMLDAECAALGLGIYRPDEGGH